MINTTNITGITNVINATSIINNPSEGANNTPVSTDAPTSTDSQNSTEKTITITRVLNANSVDNSQMLITQTITLMPVEVERIYRHQDAKYHMQDIQHILLSKIAAEEDAEDIDTWDFVLPPESKNTTPYSKKLRQAFINAATIVETLENELDHNDQYFDAYWCSVENAVNAHL